MEARREPSTRALSSAFSLGERTLPAWLFYALDGPRRILFSKLVQGLTKTIMNYESRIPYRLGTVVNE